MISVCAIWSPLRLAAAFGAAHELQLQLQLKADDDLRGTQKKKKSEIGQRTKKPDFPILNLEFSFSSLSQIEKKTSVKIPFLASSSSNLTENQSRERVF